MKYLFVTLMWNARAEMPVPGDVFAVCCQSYSPNGMTRYGRYTHLDDMSALTQWTKDAVYHNITVLETAKPRKEILNTVAETFPAYDVLVLWSRKEYELFRQACMTADIASVRRKSFCWKNCWEQSSTPEREAGYLFSRC